ncbi:YARHG domain-containing protein [Sphingobacterium sp. SRCM116780]|uniref:YARHG domain-containing protein n=1 Tax=Sphingobacterium sp. SRCM116780 TaxID=2907623 RepID=UPI001F2DB79E|nr:YARHG domain-containing protein [Sphingobacterium sp. SRCM116780]UIR57031.1 YARHG domain-containing protein [Sphingobacterium sp. SRCM116780]
MKRLYFVIFGLAVLISCHNKTEKKKTALNDTIATVIENEMHKELYGNWVGNFTVDGKIAERIVENLGEFPADFDYSPKINLTIKRITADTVIAQNVVKGNLRPLVGKMEENGNEISFILDEPGNKKSDGRFEFKLNKDTLTGSWTAFDQTVKVNKRNFKLTKKQFVYNPNLMLLNDDSGGDLIDWYNPKKEKQTIANGDSTYTYINNLYRTASPVVFTLNASKSRLTEAQLKNLKKLDLEIIRNTIFARHGYAFTKINVRQFFDPVDWYVPVSNDVTKELSQLERDNIALLTRFEKYATDNYEQFGR